MAPTPLPVQRTEPPKLREMPTKVARCRLRRLGIRQQHCVADVRKLERGNDGDDEWPTVRTVDQLCP
jgi:hypothetical protein